MSDMQSGSALDLVPQAKRREFPPISEELDKRADELDLESELPMILDERLEDLAVYFIKFRLEFPSAHRASISFAEFVKAVVSGRWREGCESDRCVQFHSTIDRKYTLKAWIEKQENRPSSAWVTWATTGFVVAVTTAFAWII